MFTEVIKKHKTAHSISSERFMMTAQKKNERVKAEIYLLFMLRNFTFSDAAKQPGCGCNM